MTQASLKLADFTHDFNVMINDFKRLEQYTDSLQAEVAAVRSTLAERDTATQMLIDDHKALRAENERLAAENKQLGTIARLADQLLACLIEFEDASPTYCSECAQYLEDALCAAGLSSAMAAGDERLDLLPVYEETG